MNEVPKKDVAIVMNALNEYLQRIIQTTQFNLQDFFKFMEPKFTEAGYRTPPLLGSRTNILILPEVAVGDFIVTTPAIREIRRIYPDANIVLVASPRTLEFAELCPYVDELIVDSQPSISWNIIRDYFMELKVTQKILEYRFDICYAFGIHPHIPLMMYFSGAKTRVTVVDNVLPSNSVFDYIAQLATNLYPYHKYGYHRADRFLAPVDNTLHAPVSNRSLEVYYTSSDFNAARNFLKDANRPIYSLTMGGTFLREHYPPECYARLLEMIHNEEPDATFLILGGGHDDLVSAQIIRNAIPEIYDKNVLDLTNKATYRQSAAILSLCDMYIGNDTGTMHVAAASKCPALEVSCFPMNLPPRLTDTPRRWYPYGVPNVVVRPIKALPPCEKNKPYDVHCCRVLDRPHCIAQITPEKIFEGFKILKQRVAEKNIEPLYIC